MPMSLSANWATMSRADRDAAYNNNAAVANSPALIEARNAASKAYRAANPTGLDVAYGAGARQRFDLYPAASSLGRSGAGADAAAPCLVFIHGGYWQRNSREDFACYAAGMRAHGWSVAMPSHTLAPDATLTEIVGEIGHALDWLIANGPKHGVAGGPVVLSGWSAGAHLTAMALSHPGVKAGLAVSGVYELGPIRDTNLNEKLRLSDAEIAALSPLRLPAVHKPLTICYGSRELPALVGDGRSLHALRASAHAPGALVPVPGADHFTILDELKKPTGALVKAALALLGA